MLNEKRMTLKFAELEKIERILMAEAEGREAQIELNHTGAVVKAKRRRAGGDRSVDSTSWELCEQQIAEGPHNWRSGRLCTCDANSSTMQISAVPYCSLLASVWNPSNRTGSIGRTLCWRAMKKPMLAHCSRRRSATERIQQMSFAEVRHDSSKIMMVRIRFLEDWPLICRCYWRYWGIKSGVMNIVSWLALH